MSEKKMVRRNVAIALGIVCIILIAGLGGAMAYYTMTVNNKNNDINTLNTTINQLNATIAEQLNTIASLNTNITNVTDENNRLQSWLDGNVLLPTDDAYVDSFFPNMSLGGGIDLEIQNSQSYPSYITYQSVIWLKFNLSSIPNGAVIGNATLHLWSFQSGPYTISAYSGSNFLNNSVIDWTEDTLTYSNMPSYNTTSMDSIAINGANQWYNWSVVDAIRDALSSNSKTATIVLFAPSTVYVASSVGFDSKEIGAGPPDYRPALTIHWQ